MIRIVLPAFALVAGGVILWNATRGDEYSTSTVLETDRRLELVMTCVANARERIKPDLRPLSHCRLSSMRRGACPMGATFVSMDEQLRLTVQPSNGDVRISVSHNQPLTQSAMDTLNGCTG